MTDYTIEAHFVVNSAAPPAAATREDRIVAAMVAALIEADRGNFSLVRHENEARRIYRAVTAMRDAMAKEIG